MTEMPGKPARTAKKAPAAREGAKPPLLSGGNPQIAKGFGEAPVQAYIAAMPGWKGDADRRLDALITATLPGVRKAVKWNSPLYGAAGQEGWFLGVHVFAKTVKVAFFRGASLTLLASRMRLICAGSIPTGTARWRASKSRIVALSSAPTLWSAAADEWIASETSLLNLRFAAIRFPFSVA